MSTSDAAANPNSGAYYNALVPIGSRVTNPIFRLRFEASRSDFALVSEHGGKADMVRDGPYFASSQTRTSQRPNTPDRLLTELVFHGFIALVRLLPKAEVIIRAVIFGYQAKAEVAEIDNS